MAWKKAGARAYNLPLSSVNPILLCHVLGVTPAKTKWMLSCWIKSPRYRGSRSAATTCRRRGNPFLEMNSTSEFLIHGWVSLTIFGGWHERNQILEPITFPYHRSIHVLGVTPAKVKWVLSFWIKSPRIGHSNLQCRGKDNWTSEFLSLIKKDNDETNCLDRGNPFLEQ
jgi:hypothetical protein